MMVVDTTTNSDVLSKKGASDPSVAMMIVPQSKEEQHVKVNSSSTKSSSLNKRNKKKSSSSHNTRTVLTDSPKNSLSEEVVKAGGQDHKKMKSSCKSRLTSSSVSDPEGKCKDEGKKEKKSKKKHRSLSSLSKVGNDSSAGSSHVCADEPIGKHSVARSDPTTNTVDSAIESPTKKNTAQSSGSSHSRSSVKSSATSKTNASSKKKKKKSSEKTTGTASKEVRKKCPPSISSTSRERRELSFASIHGRSIHKTNKKRGSVGNGSEPFTRKLPPAVLSISDRDGTVKKKSALKLKKEKQLLKKKQEQDEGEKQVTGSPTTIAKEKEDNIQKGLDISTVDSGSNSSIDDSCSIVSDGSYSADDLLFGDGTPSQAPIPPSSVDSNESSGATLGDSTFNDSGHDPHVEGSESMDDIIFDDQDEQRSSCDDQQKSSSTILSSDTITPTLASSMSSFPEEDLDFTASPESSSSSSPTSSPKATLLRNLSSKIKKIKLPLPQQQPKAQPSSRQNQDSQVAAKGLSTSETNVLRIKLPGRNRTITRHRSIDFNEKVRVKRIPCQAQMLEEDEVGNLWFQPEEYDVIKRKTMALIKAIQEENTGGVTYCTRGLERYFAIEEVQDKRNDAWDTVLDEQERQRSIRTFDAERMSRIYARCTKASFHEAMERGRLDEDAIVKYMRKARQNFQRFLSAPV